MTDLSIRIAMVLTVTVALMNAACFYGWVSAIWWLFGVLPFILLTITGFWVGHAMGDDLRGGLACTLLLCAMAWPLAVVQTIAFVALALVVVAAPRGRLRPLLVAPATLAMVGTVALSEPWVWSRQHAEWMYSIALGHAALVAIPTILYAYDLRTEKKTHEHRP